MLQMRVLHWDAIRWTDLLPGYFIRWGPGYESVYYGINNKDPNIQKEHTELYKILKAGVNLNRSEIWSIIKRELLGLKEVWNTTRQ